MTNSDVRQRIAQFARQRKVEVNSSVAWNSLTDRFSGRVVQIFTSGKVTAPRSSRAMQASQFAPVLEVEIYRREGDLWEPTGEHKFLPAGMVEPVADLRRPASYTGCMVINKNSAPDELVIYSDIGGADWFTGDKGATAKDIREQLKKIPEGKPIDLRMNSSGGDAFEGMAIYNVLAQHAKKSKSPITGYNDGITASAATVVMMAASKMVAGQQSMYMVHRGWSFAIGNRNDMMQVVDMLDRIDNQTIDLYTSYVNANGVATTRDQMTEIVDAETWFTGEEQVTAGFANEVFETRGKVAAYGSLRPWLKSVPEEIKSRFSPAATSRFPIPSERAEAA